MSPPAVASLALDHLVLGARSLEEGARWLEQRLGVSPAPGGQHLGAGTHNALLRLGQDVYLEVLAPDPGQPPPSRPRLFGLDEAATRALLERGPHLLHWVARTNGLPAALASLAAQAGLAPDDLGVATAMRRGELSWQLAVRADGDRPPAGLPSVIDWGEAAHPCTRLPDRGVRLERLELALPMRSATAIEVLTRDSRLRLARGGEGGIAAVLRIPRGEARLE